MFPDTKVSGLQKGKFMDELRYQVDLLSAMNQQLIENEKMLRLICETSNSAFLYYSYDERKVQTMAKWNHFFDFMISDIS